ncbi:hypothetical protein OH764_33535 (plasmid) [Burkholderia sp. M6-3]
MKIEWLAEQWFGRRRKPEPSRPELAEGVWKPFYGYAGEVAGQAVLPFAVKEPGVFGVMAPEKGA